MRFLHESKSISTDTRFFVGSTSCEFGLLLCERSGHCATHLRVITFKSVNIWHKFILIVRIKVSVSSVFVVKEWSWSSCNVEHSISSSNLNRISTHLCFIGYTVSKRVLRARGPCKSWLCLCHILQIIRAKEEMCSHAHSFFNSLVRSVLSKSTVKSIGWVFCSVFVSSFKVMRFKILNEAIQLISTSHLSFGKFVRNLVSSIMRMSFFKCSVLSIDKISCVISVSHLISFGCIVYGHRFHCVSIMTATWISNWTFPNLKVTLRKFDSLFSYHLFINVCIA